MGFVRRTARFGGGLVLGAAVGTAVSVLLAPQSGPELQGAARDRLEEAQRAGDEAELLETERLKREFRRAVNDPTALTGHPGHPAGAAQPGRPHPAEETEQAKALREARERQEQADKARREAAKAEREAQQARQQADQRQQEATEARREAERSS